MAVYKIKLNGIFASELEAMIFGDDDLITFKKTETMMRDANGRDLEVDLSSVGGLVNVGVDIFFMFREYKRQYPTAQMQLNIKSQAASMASMFAAGEFWDLVTVEDISSFMIHNPANVMRGDYRTQYKNAEYLERVTSLYSGVYAKKSKKSEKEIRKIMDDETYFFGEEIVKAGFADEVLKTSEEKNRDSAFATMQLKYDSVMEKLQTIKMQRKDIEKAAAMITDNIVIESEPQQKPAASGNNNQEVKMNFDDVKSKHPDTFAEIEKAGVGQERERVNMLIEMKKRKDFEGIPAIMTRIDEGIANGETMQSVELGLMALLTKNSVQATLESPGNINTGGNETMSGEQGKEPIKKEVKW